MNILLDSVFVDIIVNNNYFVTGDSFNGEDASGIYFF